MDPRHPRPVPAVIAMLTAVAAFQAAQAQDTKTQKPETKPVALLMEDQTWAALHTKRIEAVERDELYVRAMPKYDLDPDQTYDVYKISVIQSGSSGMPIRWQAVKIGRVAITDKKKGDLMVGKYTGQPFGKGLFDYRVVSPNAPGLH